MSRRKKRILLFAKPAIGDILLATPLMRSIRQAEPDVLLDIMCYPGQDAILEGNGDIDNIVVVEKRPGLLQSIQMLGRLFRKYDLAITNAADDRVHLYLLFLGKTRVSVTLEGGAAWKRWITKASVVEGGDDVHALLRNNQLGELLGYPALFSLTLPCADAGQPSPVLAQLQNQPTPYAVIHPEARLPYKRWTVEGWRQTIAHLTGCGLRIFLTGGGGGEEQRYHDAILSEAPASASSASGKFSFGETSALIAGCSLYAGIDTVNSHIAAAHGVPTVALFGPEKPARWGPWPRGLETTQTPWRNSGTQRIDNVLIIQGSAGCRTCRQGACHKRRDRGTGCPLMEGITVAQVRDGIDSMLPASLRS